jgi:hypothetical protein
MGVEPYMTYRCLIVLASASLLGCFDLGDDDCKQSSAQPGTARIDEKCKRPSPVIETGGSDGVSGVGGIGGWSGEGGATGGSGGVAGVTGGSAAIAGMTGGFGGLGGITGGSGGVGGVTGGDSGIDEPPPCEECIWIDCNVEVNACVDEGECIAVLDCALDIPCPLDDFDCVVDACANELDELMSTDQSALDTVQLCLEERCAAECATGVCTDTCEFARGGTCDDGGPESDFGACDFGTDCADCGPR